MRSFLTGFIILSLFVTLWSAGELVSEARSLSWKEAPAIVTKSSVKLVSVTQSANRGAGPVEREWYQWDFEYSYEVNGYEHRSGRASLLDTPVWNKEAALAMAAKYPVGAEVVAHVSPDDPSLAILEPGFAGMSVTLLVSSILAMIGSVWLLRGVDEKQSLRRRPGE